MTEKTIRPYLGIFCAMIFWVGVAWTVFSLDDGIIRMIIGGIVAMLGVAGVSYSGASFKMLIGLK